MLKFYTKAAAQTAIELAIAAVNFCAYAARGF